MRLKFVEGKAVLKCALCKSAMTHNPIYGVSFVKKRGVNGGNGCMTCQV